MDSQLKAISSALAQSSAYRQDYKSKNAADGIAWSIDPGDRGRLYEKLGSSGHCAKLPSCAKPSEIQQRSRELASQTFNDYHLLHDLLERHELTIRKRWQKKTTEQRRKVLLTAWPNMPHDHRPDFEAFTQESQQERLRGTKFKEAFMWPYINLEDLLKPKFLLLFLKSRGHKPPYMFALTDYDAIHMGISSHAIRGPVLHGYTMVFMGEKSPQFHGELLSWEEYPEAEELIDLGVGVVPDQGMIILEIQQKLWSFLVDCCFQILHEIPKGDILKRYPVQTEPFMVIGRDNMGFPSLSTVVAEAPYRVPAVLGDDLVRLGAIVASRRALAEDHVWSMREDPSYFSHVMLDHKEHCEELIPGINGHLDQILKGRSRLRFWNRVIAKVVTSAHLDLMSWGAVHGMVTELIDMKRQYKHRIVPFTELGDSYLERLKVLYQSLEIHSTLCIQNLRVGLPASEPLRQYFVREVQGTGTSGMRIRAVPLSECDRSSGRLLWLWMSLIQPDQVSLMGLHNLLDELERHIRADPKAKQLVTSRISNWIFDLAIAAEFMHKINHYFPWGRIIRHDAKISEMRNAKTLINMRGGSEVGNSSSQNLFVGSSSGPCHTIDPVFARANLAHLGDPTDKRFYYPVDKRRTRENTIAMRSAEANLDKFWRMVDGHYNAESSPVLEFVWGMLGKDRTLQRTPEWIEPIKQSPKTPNIVQPIERPLSELYFDLEWSTERTTSSSTKKATQPTAKAKTKSHGEPQTSKPLLSDVDASPLPTHSPPPIPKITVDRRSLRTFTTLFHVPSSHHQPGEITWIDFLHAMSAGGLSPQKLYGSVWQFNPESSNKSKEGKSRSRSIQFHEPHPTPKVPFVTARRWGRRLQRAYGWSAGSFELEKGRVK